MAWDPVKQKEVWRGAGGAGGGGGTVTTAGNLVFQVIQQGGRLVAYSADKGELLLDIATGQTGNMGPPITYMLDGKQYVTVTGRKSVRRRQWSGTAADYAGPLPSSAIPGNVQMNVPVPGGAPGPGGYAETAPCGTPADAAAAAAAGGGRGGNCHTATSACGCTPTSWTERQHNSSENFNSLPNFPGCIVWGLREGRLIN